jgi:glycosyltransferase involved in cell wall biosynthesis
MVRESGSYVGRLNYGILTLIPSFVFKCADHVITKAPYQVDYVTENYRTDIGFTVVPTGVDFAVFNPGRVSSNEQSQLGELNLPVTDFENCILYLGKLSQDKGVDNIISLTRQVHANLPSELKILCVGRTRSKEFGDYLAKAANDVSCLYVHDNQIPFRFVPELMYRVSGVILLSEGGHEGTPRVLQESCAIGTPIIASDVDGIRGEFSELEGCLLINRRSPSEFLNAITSIFEGSVSVDRNKAREKFDINNNYSKYRGAYAAAIRKSETEDDR